MLRNALLLAAVLLLAASSVQAEDSDWNEYSIMPSDIPPDAPSFDQFRVTVYTGLRKPPRIADSREAKTYRTRLARWGARPVNFAGHYVLAYWGCGTECSQISLIDVRSGKITFPVGVRSNLAANVHDELYKHAIDFRPDSRLLILIGAPEEKSELRGISYFVMNKGRLTRIRFVPKPFPIQ